MMVLGHSSVSFRALSRLAIWPPQVVVLIMSKPVSGAQQGVHLAVHAAQAVMDNCSRSGNVQAVVLSPR